MIDAGWSATTCLDITAQGKGQSVQFYVAGASADTPGVKAGRPIAAQKPLYLSEGEFPAPHHSIQVWQDQE
jgi:hypothetical protein